MTEEVIPMADRIRFAAGAIKNAQSVLASAKFEGRDVTDGEIEGRLLIACRAMRELQDVNEDFDTFHGRLVALGFPEDMASLFLLVFNDIDTHYSHLFKALVQSEGPTREQLLAAYATHLQSTAFFDETYRTVNPNTVAQLMSQGEHPLAAFTQAIFSHDTLVQIKVNNALRWLLLVRSGWATTAFAGALGRLAGALFEGQDIMPGNVFVAAESIVSALFQPMWIGVFKTDTGSIPVSWPAAASDPPFVSMYGHLEACLPDQQVAQHWHHGWASRNGDESVHRFAATNGIQNSAGLGFVPFTKAATFEKPIYLKP